MAISVKSSLHIAVAVPMTSVWYDLAANWWLAGHVQWAKQHGARYVVAVRYGIDRLALAEEEQYPLVQRYVGMFAEHAPVELVVFRVDGPAPVVELVDTVDSKPTASA